jgi:hypothetical protein
MRIVNPTFGIATDEKQVLKSGPVDWRQDAIAMFDNSKPNARALLEGVRDKLKAHRRVDNIAFVSKPSAAMPAPAELIDNVVKSHRIALLALAD